MEMQDEPYYTELENVYHVLINCPIGRRIPPELRELGSGGKPLCVACEVRLEGWRRENGR